jgi:hypothetical protein
MFDGDRWARDGHCYEASIVLANRLRFQGFEAQVYEGAFHTDQSLSSHFFVKCYDGEYVILDVTADQFNYDLVDDPQPAIVVAESWHKRYTSWRIFFGEPQILEVVHNSGEYDGSGLKNRVVYTFERTGPIYVKREGST